MNLADILHRLDYERQTLRRDGDVLTQFPHLTRLCSTEDTRHMIAWSKLDASTVDAAIDAEVEFHRGLGKPFEWKVYSHDQPTDLLQRLNDRGCMIGEKEVVLVCDLSEANWIHNPGPGLVHRVERLDQIPDFKSTAGTVFGKDYSLTANELTLAIISGSTQHLGYIAYASIQRGDPAALSPDAGQSASGEELTPAAIGRLYTHPESWFGGLYGGGTLPAYRGQGYYRATVAARARDAIRLGARYLIIDALPTSRPIVERMGFVAIAETWPAVWDVVE